MNEDLDWTSCSDFTGGMFSGGCFILFSFTSNKTRDEHFEKIRNECQNIVVSKDYQVLDTPLGR